MPGTAADALRRGVLSPLLEDRRQSGGSHFGCVTNERPAASIAFDSIASLPAARLCKDAWPLLPMDKRWRRSAIRKLPSAASGVQSEGGRPGEVDEHVLASGVAAAADAYGAIPDALCNVAPFRAALYQNTLPHRIELFSRQVAECFAPTLPPPAATAAQATVGGNRGAVGRGGSAASRRNSGNGGTTRRPSGRAGARVAAAAAAAAATASGTTTAPPDHASADGASISTLLTCPTHKKDDANLVRIVYHQLLCASQQSEAVLAPAESEYEDCTVDIDQPTVATTAAFVQSVVERELGTLLHLTAATKGPKFQHHASAVLNLTTILAAFMHHCHKASVPTTSPSAAAAAEGAPPAAATNEHITSVWEAAGSCVLSLLTTAQRTYAELPTETKAIQVLWYGRLVVPLLHLLPNLQWHTNHLRSLATLLKSVVLPETMEDPCTTLAPAAAASITSVSIKGQRGVTNDEEAEDPDVEWISFDEHVQIDNKPTLGTGAAHEGLRSAHVAGSRLRQRSPSCAAPPVAADGPLPLSWSAYVTMPYATRISVSVHVATRCETLVVCLIPEDSSSGSVTAEVNVDDDEESAALNLSPVGHGGHDHTTPQRPTTTAEAVDDEEEHSETPIAKPLESPVATECVIDVTARSAHTLEEPGAVFVRCVGASAFCHFQASVVGNVTLKLDTSCLSEAKVALTHASLWAAEMLLQSPPAVPLAWQAAFRTILAGGGVQRSESSMPRPGFLILTEPTDAVIARSLRCRPSDAPRLRLVAAIAAHLCIAPQSLAASTVECIMQSAGWLDIAKRAALNSERIAQVCVRDGTSLVHEVVSMTSPPKVPLSATAALDAAVQLVSSGATGGDVAQFLHHRYTTAQLWVTGLTSLTTTASRLQLKDMHHVARVMRGWMRGGATTALTLELGDGNQAPQHLHHYLARIAGCGEVLAVEVRQAAHRLLSYLFQSLSVAIRRMVNSSCRSHPHRYVMADAEDGTLVMLTLSLLTAPLDTKDVAFVSQSRIAEQLLEVMPNFTEFGRTNSFRVDEENEAGMATLLQTLVDQWQAFGAVHPATNGGSSNSGNHHHRGRNRRSAGGPTSAAGGEPRNNFPHAQRGQNGAWMISSASRTPWHVAKYPILDVDALASTSANEDGRTAPASSTSLPFVEVLVKAPAAASSSSPTPQRNSGAAQPSASSALTVALIGAHPHAHSSATTPADAIGSITSAKSMPQAADHPSSFYVHFDGGLTISDEHKNVTTLPWVTIQDEDIIGLGCTFNARMQRWELHLWLNGIRLAISVISAPLLFLGVGVNEARRGSGSASSSQQQMTVEVSFSPSDVHERVWHQTCLEGLGKALLLPTQHEVALYASHAYVVLMSRCARLVTKWRRATAGMEGSLSAPCPQSPVAPASPLSSGVGGGFHAGQSFQQHTLHALVEGGTERLCLNIDAVVAVLERLPPRSTATATPTTTTGSRALESPATRLKALAAHQVYQTLLLYWVGTLRVLSKMCGFQTSIVEALGRMVSCEAIDMSIRLSTMQLLSAALNDVSLVAQAPSMVPPEELWTVCLRHSAQTTASTYTPRFTEQTIGPKLALEEGGKSVAAQAAHRLGSNMKNSAYGLPGIPISPKAPDAALALAGNHAQQQQKGDTVTLSMRLSRSGRTSGSLGRYYYAGLIGYAPTSANSIFTDYTRNLGDRCFLLPDYFSEVPSHMNKSELERYRRHWLVPGNEGSSNTDPVIFGTGDIITVVVDCKKRTIAFQRNSLPLGVLFQDIKAEVVELFPLVCLYNGDASATFQSRPSEVGIRSRVLVRQLLRAWPETFAPKLLALIDDRDPVAMRVLQSDGDDFTMMQRAALSAHKAGGGSVVSPTAASATAPRFHFLRLLGDHIEAADAEGRSRYFPADSVVADYASETSAFHDIPGDATILAAQVALKWRSAFISKLIDVVTGSVLDDGDGSICVLTPRVTIRAIRLLCQLPFEVIALLNDSPLVEELAAILQLLAQMESTSSPGTDAKHMLHAAWAELDTLDEHQAVFHMRSDDPSGKAESDCDDEAVPSLWSDATLSTEEGEPRTHEPLSCAACGGPWGLCDHPAPITYCELLDASLRRQSIPSPYTGWQGAWSESGAAPFEWHLAPLSSTVTADGIDPCTPGTSAVQLAQCPRVEVVGSGEDARGRFTFTGHVVDRYQLHGVIEYQVFDRDGDASSASAPAEEPQEWACDACTFLNPNASARCGACGSGRPGSCWACPICTYAFNAVDVVGCMMCGTSRVVENRRQAGGGSQHKARCISCRGTKTFTTFETFTRQQDCPTCGTKTHWAPEDVFSAVVKGSLTTQGDALEVYVRVGGGGGTTSSPTRSAGGRTAGNAAPATSVTWHKLKSHSYTFDLLRAALRDEGDAGIYRSLQHCVQPLPTISSKKVLAAHKADIKRVAASGAASAAGGRILLPAVMGRGALDDHEAVLRMLSARLTHAVEAVTAATGGSPAGSPTSPLEQLDCTESVVRSAVQMLASRALLSWLPGLVKSGLWTMQAAGRVVAKLQYAERQWLAHWATALDASQSEELLSATLRALHDHQTAQSDLSSAAALGTVALHLLTSVNADEDRSNHLRSTLIAGLSRGCATWKSAHRDRMLATLIRCFETFQGTGHVNASSVLKLLSQPPPLHSQQRLTIFAALHSVESGQRQSAVTAAKWVTRAVALMNQSKPLPRFFDMFHPDHAPHLVVLPDTKLSDNGELSVGQVRGSVPVYPNRGGKYYYEMVLPPNFDDRQKTIVMGWGSKLHEIQGSSQHVGSDFHSWGYNGRNRVRLLTGEQEIVVPHNTAAGDVIGSLLDLDAKRMCWSINGEALQWVDIPLQGDGEPIYPYVSAAVEPHFVLVSLNETQHLPDGFTDFRSHLDDPAQHTASVVPPQSFSFYKELTSLVNELNNIGLRVDQLAAADHTDEDASVDAAAYSADYMSRTKSLVPQFPHIYNYLIAMTEDGNIGDGKKSKKEETACDEEEQEASEAHRESLLNALTRGNFEAMMVPYLKQLMCLNAMSTVVAKRTDLIRDSPYLWGLYHQAKDLLFFSARWALIDVHLSRRLNRSGDRRALVLPIDRTRAQVVAEEKQALPPTTSAPLPPNVVDDVLRNSVVGQMYHAMLGKEVFTFLTMFTVQLQDNITEDAGGVTRSILSFMCDELMWSYPSPPAASQVTGNTTTTMPTTKVEPVVPLFVPTDHSTYFNLVPNMKWLQTLTGEQEALAMKIYEWLGKLFGNAVLAGTLVYALNFPRIVWKHLAHEEGTIEDFYADCSDSDRGAINDDEFLLSDDDFYRLPGVRQLHNASSGNTTGSRDGLPFDAMDEDEDGVVSASETDLVDTPTSPVPGGNNSNAEVGGGMPPAARARLVQARRQAAIHGLLHQYDRVLERLRSGFESVVPSAAIDQMRWDDVRQRVAGSDGITAGDILANVDMTSLSEQMQSMLTHVVNTLSPQARSAFLLFATGQRRLPVPEKIRVTCGDDPNELPTAHTCSPISMMLQPYRTITEFMEKLSLSLAHVYEFGFV